MNRSRSILALISIGLLGLILSSFVASAEPSVYKVFVDDTYGFKQVRIIEPKNAVFKYENLTLLLNVGDTVIWSNDAYSTTYQNLDITIVSVQNLWDNKSGYLKYYSSTFNYTFSKPGTYEVYMKEYPRVKHQTIEVSGQEPTPSVTTPTLTPTPTETATATITPIPQAAPPAFNLMYILLALIVIVGIVILWFSIKK